MSLKEEIKRIKSLFTEERLFGNLVEGENPDTDEDGKIDSEEFKDTGNTISVDDAQEFLKKSAGLTYFDDKDCDQVVEDTPHLKCVKDAFDSVAYLKDEDQTFFQSSDTGCAIQITRLNAIFDFQPLIDLIYDSSQYTASNTNLTITFWERGKYKSETKTFAIYLQFNTPLTNFYTFDKSGKQIDNEKISAIRLRGGLKDDCTIKNLWYTEIETKGKTKFITTKHKFGKITDVNTVSKLVSRIKK